MISLNKQQLEAVTAPDGPALVLAGAGSGKTRVIIERLAWLVEERGVDPRHLLALTFTNKAAAELKERFAQRLGVESAMPWVGTFHSFGLFSLRRDMDQLGRPKSFTIFDDADQLSVMKRLIQGLKTPQTVSPREALSWVSRLKQDVKAPDAKDIQSDTEAALHGLWAQYHETLLRARAVDFDDLLVLMVKLLELPEIRDKYQRRYRYVLIDEYQDTNRAQYLIARHLSEAHRNLFVVGDEDQSIYSWRGADINNILDFSDDFPQAIVYRLEENYRSTKPILDAANALVAHNINRLGKTLRTARAGDPVRFYVAPSGEEEGMWVVQDIVAQHAAPQGTAILYRTNGQARLMEEALLRKGINYRIVGGIRFYTRKEIKDLIAYLRLVVNPTDDESVRRVLNVPARGIGGKTLELIEGYAQARRTPLFDVLRDIEMDETLQPRARQSAVEFVRLIDDLAIQAKSDQLTPLVELLLERIKFREYLRQSDEKDFRSRLDNVDEFIAACKQFDVTGGGGLLAFLQDMALVSDADEYDPAAPAVTLMTCHAAKGLEFDQVYLVGMEEGLLPLGGYDEENTNIEEERRLCYVGMTRARSRLTLTAAQSRMIYGETKNRREISRFVIEIGHDRLELLNRKDSQRPAPRQPANAPNGAELRMGVKVRHAKFGVGTVRYTQGSGEKTKVNVRFNTGRIATLMLAQAPLEIIKGD